MRVLWTDSRVLGKHHSSSALQAQPYSCLILGIYSKFLICILKLIPKPLKTCFNIRQFYFQYCTLFSDSIPFTHTFIRRTQSKMRHLSEFSVSTTAVNNKHYKSEWIDTQIFSITLDTNYNTNANEITTKLDGNRLQIKSDRKLRFL